MAQLQFRRYHPGAGALGRCSYGLPGVPGIVVFDVGLFADGKPPATITVDCPMAEPVARKVAGVTSAVVAGANIAQAEATGTAIATPPEVAAVATDVTSKIVAKAEAKGKAVRVPGHKSNVA